MEHLAVLLLLVGVVLSRGTGWRQALTIAPGATAASGHGSEAVLRNDGFTIARAADGAPTGYEAKVTVLDAGRELQGAVRLNAPLAVRGVRLYLSGYQQTADGASVTLLATRDPGYSIIMGGCLLFGLDDPAVRTAVVTCSPWRMSWVAAAAYAALLAHGARGIGWAATGAASVAWAVLTAGLAGRGLIGGHWPLTNRYEFALCWLWAIVAIYLLLEAAWREHRAGVAPLVIALVVATYALLRPADERAVWPLLPVLRSIWLQVHVLSAAIGYGACAVAAGLGILRLVREHEPLRRAGCPAPGEYRAHDEPGCEPGLPVADARHPERTRFGRRMPGAATGGGTQRNVVADHLALVPADPSPAWVPRGWQGRRLAALVVAGLGLVAFTFAGLPWVVRTVRLESLHGF